MLLKIIDEHQVRAIYNSKVKLFKDGSMQGVHWSYNVEKGRVQQQTCHNGTSTQEELENYAKKHLKRCKSNIIDIALNNCSQFEYFITLTFNSNEFPNGIYSHDNAIKLLSKWLNNQRHQNKDMCYLIVPEFHKSGRLHFHGLVGNVSKWKLVEAINPKTCKPIKENGLQIYNLLNYKLGFTTLSFIQDKQKVSNYIAKYATKELIDLKFKKRYWYSKNLQLPKLEYLYLEDNDSLLDEWLFSKSNISYYTQIEKENSTIEVLRSVPLKQD